MQTAMDHHQHAECRRASEALVILPPRLLCIALAIAFVSTIISLSAGAAEPPPSPVPLASVAMDLPLPGGLPDGSHGRFAAR